MHPLAKRVFQGDRRAVARVLSIIENDGDGKDELLQDFYPYAGRAKIIGFTGSPGVGKSTLVDQLIAVLREQGLSIAVLAVDPSSPFSGGALLGDRVRMTRHSADTGVYIRSLGSRGSHGGLSRATADMLYALEAFGCDVVLLETVGVGQAELDIMAIADTVALVMTAGAGDHVQTAKAGIMEIADIFVANKDDMPGTDGLLRELRWLVGERHVKREDWTPPIIRTNGLKGTGLVELWGAICGHDSHLKQHGYWQERRKARHFEDTLKLLEKDFRHYLQTRAQEDPKWRAAFDEMNFNPQRTAALLRADLPWLQFHRDV